MKLHLKIGLALAWLFSIDGFSQKAVNDSSLILNLFEHSSIERLQGQLKNCTTGKDSVQVLIKLSIKNYYPNARSRELAWQALALSKKNNYIIGEGLAYLTLTRLSNQSDETDSLASLAGSIFDQLQLPRLSHLTKLHTAYALTGSGENFVRIFSLINQFLSQYTLQSDHYSISVAWNVLGEVYRTIQNDEKARECYAQALRHGFINGVLINPSPLINMGTLHKNMGNFDSALFYYDRVLQLDTSRNTSMLPYILNRKSQVYLLLQQPAKALQLGEESYRLYGIVKSKVGLVMVKGTLAKVYYALHQPERSIAFAEMCVQEGKQLSYYTEEVQENCQLLTELFTQRKQYDRALVYQKIYTTIREDIFGPATNIKMYNEQFKLENRSQELEKTLLLEKQLQAEAEIRTQRQIISVIAVALIISLGLAFLLFRKNKTIESLLSEVRNKNEEITAQSEELKASKEEIEAINANLENLVKERSEKVINQNKKLTEYAFFNAHKVRGPLARILGLVNIMTIELEKESLSHFASMLKQAGDDLDISIKQVNIILESEEDKDES